MLHKVLGQIYLKNKLKTSINPKKEKMVKLIIFEPKRLKIIKPIKNE